MLEAEYPFLFLKFAANHRNCFLLSSIDLRNQAVQPGARADLPSLQVFIGSLPHDLDQTPIYLLVSVSCAQPGSLEMCCALH